MTKKTFPSADRAFSGPWAARIEIPRARDVEIKAFLSQRRVLKGPLVYPLPPRGLKLCTSKASSRRRAQHQSSAEVMSVQVVTKPLSRLTGLFRGGILQSSFGTPLDPASSHAQQSLPQLFAVAGSRCGRQLDKDRHPYRPSRGKVITNSFLMSTFNVQSFQWDLLSQRDKLQHLILSHRK